MNFQKFASVSTIAVATADENGFAKAAAYENGNNSAYLNNKKPINIKAALEIVASEYDISSNPGDYMFEAIRGNTSNVPNDNKDGFHKNELLRFDHRLGKQVYRTYELKPHHVNHRAENPKNARGFILDAHYNDASPPVDVCPTEGCGNKTAEVGNRDPETGIHCNKCGAVVKDEFVELLVAIDAKKDPTFANGVKSGVLKHGSMGCSCLRTRCNICNHVAYSRSEFCKHIASGKGKDYDESEPNFSPIAFTIKYPKDKTAGRSLKTAKSFEWCEGVIYDEYSRVHDPADIKAEQYEILKLSQKVASLTDGDKLENESEILVLQTKLAELERKLESKLSKIAQAMPPMPLPGLPGPGSMAPPPPPGGLGLPGEEKPDEESTGDINVVINPPSGVSVEGPAATLPGTPIEELSPEEMGATPAGPGGKLTPEAMGMLPTPPKRGQKEIVGGPSMMRFASSYKDLKAEITTAGNIRIHDNDGTLFVVKPERITDKTANITSEELAKRVLTMIAQSGIGGTINKTNAIMGPRLANVLEYSVDDMLGTDRTEPASALTDVETDTEDKRPKSDESATASGSETDRKEPYDENAVGLGDTTIGDREVDMEDENNPVGPEGLNVTEKADSDKKDKPKEFKMKTDTAIKDIALDHQGKAASKDDTYDIKLHASRLEKIYNSRLEKKIAEINKEKEDFAKNMTDRLARAMKLIAKRQALNLEYSPMKTAMGIVLCNPCSLGDGYDYKPMDQKTAVTLVEAAFNDYIVEGNDKPAWETFIDGLIERAASIMKWNDDTLMQVESDMNNIKSAAVPLVEEAPHNVDVETRQAAKHGNLQLAPTSPDDVVDRQDKRNNIRQAVGTTKVASLASLR